MILSAFADHESMDLCSTHLTKISCGIGYIVFESEWMAVGGVLHHLHTTIFRWYVNHTVLHNTQTIITYHDQHLNQGGGSRAPMLSALKSGTHDNWSIQKMINPLLLAFNFICCHNIIIHFLCLISATKVVKKKSTMGNLVSTQSESSRVSPLEPTPFPDLDDYPDLHGLAMLARETRLLLLHVRQCPALGIGADGIYAQCLHCSWLHDLLVVSGQSKSIKE